MSAQTRANLATLLNSKVISGGGLTSAQDMRDLITGLIESMLNILDDKEIVSGYVSLDTDGNINEGLIKEPVPAGKFLRDDGTWANDTNGITTEVVTIAVKPMVKDHQYVTLKAGGVNYQLPAVAAVGDTFYVVGLSAGGWTISLSSVSQLVHYGNSTTTVGTGTVASTQQYSSVKVVCVAANTDFVLTAVTGTINIT